MYICIPVLMKISYYNLTIIIYANTKTINCMLGYFWDIILVENEKEIQLGTKRSEER